MKLGKYIESESGISIDGKHRLYLKRRWFVNTQDGKDCLLWVMLNPSIASGTEDDMTVRKCIEFSKRLGFGAMLVVNLYTYITTKPDNLFNLLPYKRNDDKANDIAKLCISECEYGIIATGNIQNDHVVSALTRLKIITSFADKDFWYTLGFTKSRWPRHPSRISYDIQIERYHE